MKVSVVLPVYETEKHLRKCLNSVLKQTLYDIEVIVINDASPDGSLKIIREYEKKDKRIRVFDVCHSGVAGARNLGLKSARGECVCFLDSDDYIHRDMLKTLYDAIEKNSCEMAVCNMRRVFDDHVEKPFFHLPEKSVINVTENNWKFIRDVLGERVHTGGSVSNKMFVTKFLKNSGIEFADRGEIFAEDAFFYFKILGKLKKICIVDEAYYFYYQRGTSESHVYKKNLLARSRNFLIYLDEYYKGFSFYKEIKQDLKIRNYSFFLEILHNETMGKMKYSDFIKILNDEYFRDATKGVDVSAFSKNRRLIYFLYSKRLYLAIYLIFAFNKEMNIRA